MQKWKRHSERIVRSRRTRIRRLQRRVEAESVPPTYSYALHEDRVHIPAPSDFSIIRNADAMLGFFASMDFFARKGHQVYLDLSSVESLEPDAVLYLLSRLSAARRLSRSRIFGMPPKDKKAKDRLTASGFYDFVGTGIPKNRASKTSGNFLRIKSGSAVEPDIVAAVKDFTRERLGKMDLAFGKSLYSALIECMANSKNHAYTYGGSWWLSASYEDQPSPRVRFVFLDNGKSIPYTVRRTLLENIQLTLFPSLPTVSDAQLISSALNGTFRTQTGLKHRGKGLPKIYQSAKAGSIANLVVLSRQGMVIAENDELRMLPRPFGGTMLAWDFLPEKA
jgi:hypothetical protein